MDNQDNQPKQPTAEELMSKLSAIPEEKLKETALAKAVEILKDSVELVTDFTDLNEEEFGVDDKHLVVDISLLRIKEITQTIPKETGELTFLNPIINFWNLVVENIKQYSK